MFFIQMTAAGALLPSVRGNFLKTFSAGSEISRSSSRAVDLVDVAADPPMAVGRTPVTRAQWELVVGNRPWLYNDNGTKSEADASDGEGALPVTGVSWQDAEYFCEALTRLDKECGLIREDQDYRLPTSQEWEHAARAGSTEMFFFGDDVSLLEEHAWFSVNSGGHVHPVGMKKPNGFGLHDIHGNVSEMCSDTRDDDDEPYRIHRGGSYQSEPSDCACSEEGLYSVLICGDAMFGSSEEGFRVVLPD